MSYSRTISRRSKRSPLGLIIAFLIIAGLVAAIFMTSLPKRAAELLERDAPQITLQMPQGFGAETQKILIILQDSGAGLRNLTITAAQGELKAEVLRKDLEKEKSVEIPLEFNAKKAGFRDGPIEFHASASDYSYAANRAERTVQSHVLLTRPQVETLTSQHNVAQGGAGLVVYRIIAGKIADSGVKVGDREFPGYPVEAFGGSGAAGVKAALFVIPKNFDDRKEGLKVFARDIAGNQATSEVNFRILKKKFAEVPMKAPEAFLRRKMPILLPGYSELSGKEAPTINDASTRSELVSAFRLVNEDYRGLLDKQLQDLLSKSSEQRLWQSPFARPVAGSPTSGFGERRVYTSEGEAAGGSVHDGVDLAALANVEIRPAQRGRVVFTGDLGIYGSTVLIDHGLGLSTLYGHLSSISVNPGDAVTLETVLGRSGSTGLAGGDHLHFEIRLWNTPVSPFEWWDAKWCKDHVDDKIMTASTPPSPATKS